MNGINQRNGDFVEVGFAKSLKWGFGIISTLLVAALLAGVQNYMTLQDQVRALQQLVAIHEAELDRVREWRAETLGNRYTAGDAQADRRAQTLRDNEQDRRLERHDERLDRIDDRLAP